MASSSDAIKPRQLQEASRGARGLTRVEGWLKGGKSVVLEHVEERLLGIQLACGLWIRERLMNLRSFRRYRGRERGSLHSCGGGLLGRGLDIGIKETEGKKGRRTQLGKDIPKPVHNKHRRDTVSVRWMKKVR